jgi:tRNA pseudouridine55 synthase
VSATLNPNPIPPEGIIVIDKPHGRSSMAMVIFTRHRAQRRKTGHAGTLDPLATGVLVLAIGRATKSIPLLMDTSKRYRTEIDLSVFSPSDDLESEPVPVDITTPPTRDHVRAILDARFTGAIMQRPPIFSAIMIDGRRAYKSARAGDDITMEQRSAFTHSIDIVDFDFPRLTLDVECAKGFYVRSLARELGAALGTGGMCRSIHRTAVGPFTIDMAVRPEDVGDSITQDMLISLDEMRAMLELPPTS